MRAWMSIDRGPDVVFGVAMLLAAHGCATVQVVPAEQLHEQALAPGTIPVAHVYAANWGVYLFKYVPLVAGSLSRPGAPRWPAFFTDEVRVDRLVAKVSEESQNQGGTIITDLRTRDRSAWMPATFILWLNEFEVSANASRSTRAVGPVGPMTRGRPADRTEKH
jgi:hypothetical protein